MTTVLGRLVTCPVCRETIRRYELPQGPIGSDTCGTCLVPVRARRQILTGNTRSLRRRAYNPETSEIPY